MRNRATRLTWLWALLPLLLAAALAIPLLDADSFNGDEPSSLRSAGAFSFGPWPLASAWRDISEINPYQAYGWPLLLTPWGRIVGWGEPAVRALSFFAGMLALAWVYRAGRDFLAPGAGLSAALLFSVSAFLLTYMAHARVFTLVALFTTLCLWSYWRITLHARPPHRATQAGLLLAATGMLYAHYFCALFLAGLGLYHLLFVSKTRRWWQPTILLALAVLLASAQLPGLLQGYGRVSISDSLHKASLTASAPFARFVHLVSNGLLNPASPATELLAILLTLAAVIATVRYRRGRRRERVLWFVGFVTATTLATMLAVNEVLMLIKDNQIRYLMPLWPMTMLLAGAGLWRMATEHRRLVAILLVFWVIHGAWLTLATEFRYELGYFRGHSDRHITWRTLRERIPAGDLVVLDNSRFARDPLQLLYLPPGTIVSRMDERLAEMMPLHAAEPSVWLLYDRSLSRAKQGVIERDDRLERILCERVQHPALDKWELRLERFVLHPSANCPDSPVRLEFDGGIWLIGPRTEMRAGLLRLDAHFHSADEGLLARYSLAVHVIDPSTGERVAQGDTGVGPGSFVSLRSEIDVSALPAGEYEVRVALYDWQTGERLSARDPETGTPGDIHALQRIRID